MSCIHVIYWRKKGKVPSPSNPNSQLEPLSSSAFKIGYCYKVPLLCLHCLLSSISTNGLNLMPGHHQMLRQCTHEWAWGRHMGDPRHWFQSCNDAVSLFKGRMLDQSPKTRGVARSPEQKQLMLLSLGWGFQNTPDQQPCDHMVVGQAVTCMDMFWMMNFKLLDIIAASLT